MMWELRESLRVAIGLIIFSLASILLGLLIGANLHMPAPAGYPCGGTGTTPATGSADRGRTI